MVRLGGYLADVYTAKPRSELLCYDYNYGKYDDYFLSTDINYFVIYDEITQIPVLELILSDDNLIDINYALNSTCDNLGVDNNDFIPRKYEMFSVDLMPTVKLRRGMMTFIRKNEKVIFSVLDTFKNITVFSLALKTNEVLALYNKIDSIFSFL